MAELIILAKHRRVRSKAMTEDGRKICNTCKEAKTLDLYEREVDGKCKSCKNELHTKRRKARIDNEFGGFF